MSDRYEAEFIGKYDFRIVKKTTGGRKKRIYGTPTPGSAQKIICEVFKNSNYSQDREHAVALYIKGRNLEVKGGKVINIGTQSGVTMHPASIIRDAILIDADMVVLAHNHPSGELMPSTVDIESAKEMKEKLDVADITLIDFMVIDPETGKSVSALHQPRGTKGKFGKWKLRRTDKDESDPI